MADMDIQITIDDPAAYTKPWNFNVAVGLVPNAESMGFVCPENESQSMTETRVRRRLSILVRKRQIKFFDWLPKRSRPIAVGPH